MIHYVHVFFIPFERTSYAVVELSHARGAVGDGLVFACAPLGAVFVAFTPPGPPRSLAFIETYTLVPAGVSF